MARFRIDSQMSSEEDDGSSARDFLWTLFAFKLVTTVIIFWHMRTWVSGLVLGANFWYFLPIMGVMAAAPLMLRHRMRRQRARRRELLRSEWMIGPGEDDRVLAAILRDDRFRG